MNALRGRDEIVASPQDTLRLPLSGHFHHIRIQEKDAGTATLIPPDIYRPPSTSICPQKGLTFPGLYTYNELVCQWRQVF